jgi:hypothetical protein
VHLEKDDIARVKEICGLLNRRRRARLSAENRYRPKVRFWNYPSNSKGIAIAMNNTDDRGPVIPPT